MSPATSVLDQIHAKRPFGNWQDDYSDFRLAMGWAMLCPNCSALCTVFTHAESWNGPGGSVSCTMSGCRAVWTQLWTPLKPSYIFGLNSPSLVWQREQLQQLREHVYGRTT